MHRHGGWNKTTSPRPPARLPGARWPCIYLFLPARRILFLAGNLSAVKIWSTHLQNTPVLRARRRDLGMFSEDGLPA